MNQNQLNFPEIDQELLHDALTYDILNETDVLNKIRTMKIKNVLELHPYAITPPKGEKGRWQTYIDSENGRKKIAKTKEKDLYDVLISFYLEQDRKNITLEDFFPEWMQKKKLATGNESTLRRHMQHWRKYYETDSIIKCPLRSITKEMIEDFFHIKIKEFKLSQKELANMKTIFKGAMELALERKIIAYNPFASIKINYKLCRFVPKKSNTEQVYLPDEKERFMSALDHEFQYNPTITNTLAVRLLFQLGTRVGELVALRWSDIENNAIHITRMEQTATTMEEDLTFSTPKNIVVDHVKTNNDTGDRYLHLTPNALDLLKKIKEMNDDFGYKEKDYIFCGKEGRTTRREIQYTVEKVCKKADMPVKSPHDIRRTVASTLSIHQVPLDEIRRFLGHQNETTTLGYIYNPYGEEKTNQLIDDALEN